MHSSMIGPVVADRIERRDPGVPVDRAEAGGIVGVAGGRRCRGRGSCRARGRRRGSRRRRWRRCGRGRCRGPGPARAGPARRPARPGRPSGCPGWTPGGMFSTQTTRPRPGRRGRPAPAGRSARASRRVRRLLGVGQAAGVDDQERARRPRPASRRNASGRRRWLARRGSGRGRPRSTRFARIVRPPQHPWALWMVRPGVRDAGSRSGAGSGRPPQSGRISR